MTVSPIARVAGGALNDRIAGAQPPAGLGVGDDPQRRAVLDRAARIHEFGLAEDFATGQFAEAPKPNQGRAADVAVDPIVGGRARWHR